MIDWITIEGFKSIASVQKLPLRPINILIGANGSGKSNFLDAFEVFRNLGTDFRSIGALEPGYINYLFHRGESTTERIRFLFPHHDASGCYESSIESVFSDGRFRCVSRFLGDDGRVKPLETDNVYFATESTLENTFHSVLSGWQKYHCNNTSFQSHLRVPAILNDNRSLRKDGSNLASYLFLLKEKYPNSLKKLEHTISRSAPFFKGFDLRPEPINERYVSMNWRHQNSDQFFDALMFSDGTLRFIFWAAVLLQPNAIMPKLLLIDEPELGLHPFAISLLSGMIRAASAHSQVIVSTQSMQLIDYFTPEDVIVADRVNGATEFHRLDSRSLKIWLKDYSLGEIWDKNIIGGRPKPE